MGFDLSGLGELIRAFREDRRLSQPALARQILPATNRSVIAHLEQGLRLPPAGVLRAICDYLEIPHPLWERFAVRADEYRAGKLVAGREEGPRYIAVAGVSGSGKTTLARSLANVLGCRYLPAEEPGKKYLNDLTHDPDRWAFETQLAFLSSKALQVLDSLVAGSRFVLDRSLHEDIYVFAEYFRARGQISERSYETYHSLANHFLSVLPSPDLILYCQCDLATALERINKRRRSDIGLHTIEHVREIHRLCERWISSYTHSTVCIMDSTQDWREPKTVQTIAREIGLLWSEQTRVDAQLDLFEVQGISDNLTSAPSTLTFRMAVDRRPVTALNHETPRDGDASNVLPFPSVYIAAPFTAAAEDHGAADGRTATLFQSAHGRIPRQRYRRALEAIDGVLRALGFHTVLPHRDINAWGAIQLTPEQVARQCSAQVAGCDVFVGLPGASHGTHFEFGIARGLNKPAIVIHCDEVSESFIAKGFLNDERLFVIHCATLSMISGALRGPAVAEYLAKFVPLRTRAK